MTTMTDLEAALAANRRQSNALDPTERSALRLLSAHLHDDLPIEFQDALAAHQRVQDQLVSLDRAAPPETTVEVLQSALTTVWAGQPVPAQAGARLLAAERADTETAAQRRVVLHALDHVDQRLRALLHDAADVLLVGPVRARHDDVMRQAETVVATVGAEAVIDQDALLTEGAAGTRLRAAVRTLTGLHDQLRTVHDVHRALFSITQVHREAIVPGLVMRQGVDRMVSMADLARCRALWTPAFATVWPQGWHPQPGHALPMPSPWDASPAAVMALLVTHGAWVPDADELETAWLDADASLVGTKYVQNAYGGA